jgi:hypothetical protein
MQRRCNSSGPTLRSAGTSCPKCISSALHRKRLSLQKMRSCRH